MTRARRTRTPHRLLAGLTGIALLAAVALAPTAQTTEASWADAEVGAAEFTARTVPTPISTQTPGCVASGGLLGLSPSVTIYWRIPPEATGYTQGDAEFGEVITSGLLEPLLGGLLGNTSTTGTPESYVTKVKSGLLTGLLGASKSFGIRLTGPGEWTSDWLVAHASIGIAGANPKCEIEIVPS